MNNFEEILPEERIIGVLRPCTLDEGKEQVFALHSAGLNILEISLNSPIAFDLFDWAKENCPNLCLGVASILTVEQAQLAQNKGFDFFVSPIADNSLMRFALDEGLIFIPGACTPTEIAQILKFFDFPLLKLFPVSSFEHYKGIKKIFSQKSFLLSSFPVNKIKNFSQTGSEYFAIGSFLTDNLASLDERINFIRTEILLSNTPLKTNSIFKV